MSTIALEPTMNENADRRKATPAQLSPTEERAKKQSAIEQKVVTGCGFAGAATFFVLNVTTGVVPGGMLGGAIGGALGAVVGVIINSARRQ
jgi:Flp pilus assembly protein TadB